MRRTLSEVVSRLYADEEEVSLPMLSSSQASTTKTRERRSKRRLALILVLEIVVKFTIICSRPACLPTSAGFGLYIFRQRLEQQKREPR